MKKQNGQNQEKSAFTLSEVLIALTVIGVIAAITIQSIITQYQKEKTIIRLKKSYSTIAQAIYRARTESNLDTYTDLIYPQQTDFATKFLYPYLQIQDTCSTDKTPKCNGEWTYLNNSGTSKPTGGFVLSDGTYVGLTCWHFTTNREDFCNISIDINGTENSPNKFGKDYFIFQYYLNQNSQLVPYGNMYSANYLYGTSAGENCNKERKGSFCAALIMKEGWEISSHYPW